MAVRVRWKTGVGQHDAPAIEEGTIWSNSYEHHGVDVLGDADDGATSRARARWALVIASRLAPRSLASL